MLTGNDAHATTGKTRCVAHMSRSLHLSQATNKNNFKIFDNLTGKSKFLIYRMECVLYKIHYVKNPEIPFNLRFYNHKSDLIETRSPHLLILCKTNIYSTNMQNLH